MTRMWQTMSFLCFIESLYFLSGRKNCASHRKMASGKEQKTEPSECHLSSNLLCCVAKHHDDSKAHLSNQIADLLLFASKCYDNTAQSHFSFHCAIIIGPIIEIIANNICFNIVQCLLRHSLHTFGDLNYVEKMPIKMS